jgi:hypothetical protein
MIAEDLGAQRCRRHAACGSAGSAGLKAGMHFPEILENNLGRRSHGIDARRNIGSRRSDSVAAAHCFAGASHDAPIQWRNSSLDLFLELSRGRCRSHGCGIEPNPRTEQLRGTDERSDPPSIRRQDLLRQGETDQTSNMPYDRPLTKGEALLPAAEVKRQSRLDDQYRGSRQVVGVLGKTSRRGNYPSRSQEALQWRPTQSCLQRPIPAAGHRLAWIHDSHK